MSKYSSRTLKASGSSPAQDQDLAGLGDKRDVARLAKVSVRTVEEWVKARKIPFIKMSHRVLRFDLTAVKAALCRWTTTEIK